MERRFPLLHDGVHGRSGETIPWDVAVRVWEAYDKRHHNGQTVERIAERGGFAPSEMDDLYPAWRNEVA